MIVEDLRNLLKTELPEAIRDNPELHDWVLQIGARSFADRVETDKRFDQVLDELKRDREIQSRRWEEQKADWERRWKEQNLKSDRHWEGNNRRWEEDDRRWEENDRRWEENDRHWAENARRWEENDRRWEENDRHWEENDRRWENNDKRLGRIERSLGAMGARWGLKTENSFRKGLAGILEENFRVKVLNVNEYDEEGEVFGHPDQIELDIIIKNGLLLICELKSSVSGADMYIFQRKARFYEKRHRRQADRLIVISPMISPKALEVAGRFAISTYGDSSDIEAL
uniref:PD-(D/E)XK nuclease superfamily protein n=1 Tax=Candidatus Kentrum sp. LFY TaxID=2126342 RepID=A0A450U5X5_9GAMM|nr:MAG: PD-(D/E)XK nuclease superfamily protein [Candidatus Kentron sp. LFY]